MDFNKIVLGGRLVADPELVTLPSGVPLATFSLAVNRRWKDSQTNEPREEVCFIDVKCFGKRSQAIQDYFKKGRQILLEGTLRQERWEKEGEKKSKHVVVLDNFSFVDRREPDDRGPAREDVPGEVAGEVADAGGVVARRRRERAFAGAAAVESAASKLPLPF